MWRGREGPARRVGRGGGWVSSRGGAAEVRLLEQVQHEDVAEGSEADAPQEASLCC